MRHRSNAMLFRVSVCLSCAALLTAIATPTCAQLLTSSDLSRLRSVGSAAISPDGHYIAYSITMRDLPGRPYGQLWVMDLSTAKRPPGRREAGQRSALVERQQVDRVPWRGWRQAQFDDRASGWQ